MKSIPFTYRVKNKTTGKFYYGVRYAKNCSPKDLWTIYFTSSKKVKNLIELYGIDDFEIEICKTFETSDEAIKWEQEFNSKILNDPNYLNENCGTAFSKESCARGAINFAKNNPERKRKICQKAGKNASITNKKNKSGAFHDKNIQSKAGKKGSEILKLKGRFKSDEWRKISSRSEYKWYTDGLNNKRIHINKISDFEKKISFMETWYL
jgi:general stress protein YciG